MELKHYIIRRFLLLIPTLIGVTLLIFAVIQLFSPVERAALYIRDPRQARDLPGIIKKYHLDEPVYVQYYYWLREVLRGNLGYSKSVNMPVLDAILNFFPATIELVLYSAPLIVLLGIKLGVLAAIHKDRAVDHLTRISSIIGWSLPSFWLGILLLAMFYGQLGIFPPERLGTEASVYVNSPNFIRYTKINTIDALLNGQLWIFIDALKHLVLPVTSLTIQIVALIVRIMRSSMLEALNKGYVLAARAKGLEERDVIYKHARKNALIPVFTVTGILLAGMLTGVIITETVFNYKGIGYWAAHAATQLDIPAVLGFALLAGVIFVLTNLIVDILYAYIDPRVRLG
ncbi:ABC transporter permease [Candidatus Bathyarchaeota archaeon]|nr:MAG: ABC transporter permease [Candidatus Bathyarchaeota archaeon]RLG99121.1 MAG: ABC transporter permease [Candidatus Bathyarchaeota archaeon]RLI23439.1 MAG: ABC transporter permease [Candidatus Bathyarchaeota archaeon]HDN62395.1 ABC transporter permease [Candidatus Bathyarchaeota archaeon]